MSSSLKLSTVLFAAACLAATPGFAQGPRGRYFPLDQNTPPGVAGQWSTAGRRGAAQRLQAIRVELPGSGGLVSFYPDCDGQEQLVAAPAQASIRLGSVYRLKLSGLEEFPGVELYPTVELLDRLHPPCGREQEFPVPITITEDEIRLVLEGRMITKVVYLEQPDRAAPVRNETAARTRLAGTRDNPLALADESGRPMAILRLGTRTPDLQRPEPGFFGTGGPIEFPATTAAVRGEVSP